MTCPEYHATIDYDSYNTDGQFAFAVNGVYTKFPNFANLQSTSPLEHHGQILTAVCPNGSVFTSCLLPPANNQTLTPAQDVTPGPPRERSTRHCFCPTSTISSLAPGRTSARSRPAAFSPSTGPARSAWMKKKAYTCNGYR